MYNKGFDRLDVNQRLLYVRNILIFSLSFLVTDVNQDRKSVV